MEKQCFKCGKVKPLEDFYAHPRMKDGHLNKCKECTKSDVTAHRNAHIEDVREYDRKRSASPDFRKRQNSYILKRKTEDPDGFREMRRESNQRYKEKYRDKAKAHWAVSDAIIAGKMISPKKCERCGVACKPEAHHEDYTKPLEVIWLCGVCHKMRHREINAEKRKPRTNNVI